MLPRAPQKNSKSPATDENGGLRMTRQRQEVYQVLLAHRDHPTATDVFLRVKDNLPSISLATVYNCLEVLVEYGLVKQVNFERESSRYCPNLEEHGHFHDRATGTIHDVKFKPGLNLDDVLELPPGAIVQDVEINLRGRLHLA
jgi:Fe2+ or Zn2+ uptake regulation protein